MSYFEVMLVSEYVDTPCWIWCKALNERGYAQFWCKPHGKGESKNHRGHRVSYMHFRGEIAEGMQLDHLCQIECCVNPWHLEQVSNGVNSDRKWGVLKGWIKKVVS
jgi:hypothetical protein